MPLDGTVVFGSLLLKVLVVCSLLLAITIQGCLGQQQQQQQQPQLTAEDLLNQVKADPRNADTRFQFGWFLMNSDGANSDKGIYMLQSCFDSNEVDKTLGEVHPLKGYFAAALIGRYMKEQRDSETAVKFLKIAYHLSKTQMSPDRDVGEVCVHLQLATHLDSFPLSNKHVDESLADMDHQMKELIDLYTVPKHKDVYLNEEYFSNTMPGFATDPYVHCHLTLFPLSFYYRADVARIANQHYQLASLVWPNLLYIAKHVQVYDDEQKLAALKKKDMKDDDKNEDQLDDDDDDAELSSSSSAPFQKCIDRKTRKIKLGVISSTFNEGHSVAEDFGGILQRLDRNVFEVTYANVHEKSSPQESAAFLTANQEDKLIHYKKDDTETNDGAWIRRIGWEIEELQFDIILYLDMTMSTFIRRLGMERLAPVQLNTHGHPVTSGHPREIIQHFVSWAEAELPLEESQTHYTEELQLIPKGKIHQYYTPRIQKGPMGRRISRMNGQPFDHLTRKDFEGLPAIIQNSSADDDDIHLYVCMQKPFKVFPEFDELLCGVLKEDPKGHAILHKDDQTGQTDRFLQRMKTAGCDMDRVHFISSQLPHKLMYLYDTADVILDSYPAGGCTTTREALELGTPVVTWPARLLGGRWTLGLYNIIGLDEESKNLLIADSKEDYIAKAVELGTNKSLRKTVKTNILNVLPNLFGREDAVEEWEKILLRVSPVKQCSYNDDDENDNEGEDDNYKSSPENDEL